MRYAGLERDPKGIATAILGNDFVLEREGMAALSGLSREAWEETLLAVVPRLDARRFRRNFWPALRKTSCRPTGRIFLLLSGRLLEPAPASEGPMLPGSASWAASRTTSGWPGAPWNRGT